MNYFAKMKGTTKSPPGVGIVEIVWSWLGGFIGIGAVALVQAYIFDGTDLILMIGSFGASAVLVYGAIKSPLAQPRNLVGGHFLSALVGVAAFKIFQGQPVLAAASCGCHCNCGDARHKDASSPWRRHRSNCRYRRGKGACARFLVCRDTCRGRRGNSANSCPAVQQHTEKPEIPRVLALI